MNSMVYRLKHLAGVMLLLAVLLSMSSCGWSILPPKGDPLPLNMATFYQSGRTWTYSETYADSAEATLVTKKVVEQTQYHDHTAWQIATTVPDNPLQMQEYLAFDAATGTVLGIEVVDSSTQTTYDYPYLPGVRFSALLAPGSPLVSSYTTSENDVQIQWSVESQVLSTTYEQVQVPAGQYDQALKVRTRVTTTRSATTPFMSDTFTIEEDTWYAPELGMVKSQAADGSHTAVLVEYTP